MLSIKRSSFRLKEVHDVASSADPSERSDDGVPSVINSHTTVHIPVFSAL